MNGFHLPWYGAWIFFSSLSASKPLKLSKKVKYVFVPV